MKTCEHDGEPFATARSHPWTDAQADSACRYYDLKAAPELIRTALEDFVPWNRYPAISSFFELLDSVNGPASVLESNDCAFSGPHASEAPHLGKSLQCEGRVMLLHRELALNLSRPRLEALKNGLHLHLAPLDPDFEFGMIGTTIPATRYIELPVAHDQQLGYQLMLSFWAWGDSEAEVMDNLERVVTNLAEAVGVAAAGN